MYTYIDIILLNKIDILVQIVPNFLVDSAWSNINWLMNGFKEDWRTNYTYKNLVVE